MAALVAMAGVNAGSDETVTQVKAGAEGGLHIGAVAGIDVNCVICLHLFGSFNELADYLVGVGAAGVLGADADLPLGAAQTLTTQPMSTEIASVTPSGTDAAPP